jgi:hypothetical protein
MKNNLLTISVLVGVFFVGLQNTNAATINKRMETAKSNSAPKICKPVQAFADTIVKKHLQKTAGINKSFYGNIAYNMPVQTTDSGNYGFHLQLSQNQYNYIQTGIYFYTNASDKYVFNEDAAQIDGPSPGVFLSSYSSDNKLLCINTMSDYAKGKRIRLYVNATWSGTDTLSLADIFGMDTVSYNLYLIDNQKHDSVDIVHQRAYTFNINLADTNSFGANRFVLSIEHKPVEPYKLSAFTGQKVSSGVKIDWSAVNAGNYTGYTLQRLNNAGGFDSLYSIQSDPNTTAYSFIDTHPQMGNNVYRLEQNGITGAITYSAAITVSYSSISPNGAINVYPNPAQNSMTVSLASNTINSPTYVADTYDLSGNRVSHQTVSAALWTNDISKYKSGLYFIQVKDTNGNVVGQSKFMKSN